eukprot:365011-Chlamydomonas_euryale.AAC.15
MHGIAMADAAQEAPDSCSGDANGGLDASNSGGGTGGGSSDGGGSSGKSGLAIRGSGTAGAMPGAMPASEGAAALQLLAESLERHGSPGAFMVPSWGCGSLAEAFVRCCAVNGATTVLRARVAGALLRPSPRAGLSDGDGGVAHSAPAVEAVVTASGQVLRCRQLVAGAALAHALRCGGGDTVAACATGGGGSDSCGVVGGGGGGSNSSVAGVDGVVGASVAQPLEHRALLVMDAPLVQQTQTLALVLPPRSALLRGANPHAVRGLQMGPSLAVCPNSR